MDRFSRLTLDTYSVMGLITSILSWMLSTPETCNVTGLSSLFVAFMLYRNYPPLKPLTPALASILNNPTAVSTASTSSTTRMDISGYADGSAFSIKPISAAASVRLISSLYLLRKGTVHGSCPPIHANARPTTAMTTAVIPSRVASGSCTNCATCGDAHPARMKLSDTINTKIFLISISLFILFPQIRCSSAFGGKRRSRRGPGGGKQKTPSVNIDIGRYSILHPSPGRAPLYFLQS